MLCVLVAAYYSDLESEHEAASGYFSRPWDWEAMRSNVNWVVQFHSEVTFYNLRVLDYHRFLPRAVPTDCGWYPGRSVGTIAGGRVRFTRVLQ